MKHRIIACGKPALAYARTGIDEYAKRLQRYAQVESVYLKEKDDPARAVKQGVVIVMDERGKALTTQQWADELSKFELNGQSTIHWLIGPGDGHAEATRKAADAVWQLAPMTMNHELALLVLYEQIYRAETVRAGHPYHRA